MGTSARTSCPCFPDLLTGVLDTDPACTAFGVHRDARRRLGGGPARHGRGGAPGLRVKRGGRDTDHLIPARSHSPSTASRSIRNKVTWLRSHLAAARSPRGADARRRSSPDRCAASSTSRASTGGRSSVRNWSLKSSNRSAASRTPRVGRTANAEAIAALASQGPSRTRCPITTNAMARPCRRRGR